MKRIPTYSRRHAFTLTELLAVIAIIGILAAIIIPIVGSIRENAKNTQSLNNLRQVATALNVYATDNKGRYPIMGDGIGFTGNLWPTRIQPYISPKIYTGKIFRNGSTVDTQSPTLLDPIVADGNHHDISDYGNNAQAIRAGDKGALPVSTIAVPSQLVLVLPVEPKTDGTQAVWYLGETYYQKAGTVMQPSDRGNPGRFKAGFADGHVGMINLDDMQDINKRKRCFLPDPESP